MVSVKERTRCDSDRRGRVSVSGSKTYVAAGEGVMSGLGLALVFLWW